MRQVAQAIKDAIWNGNCVAIGDLVTLFKEDGSAWARWTNAQADVTVGSTTWSAAAPVIKLPQGTSDVGLAVDARDVELGGQFVLDGKTIQQHALAGDFDNCRLLWERAYGAPTYVGTVERFDGVILNAEPRSKNVRLRVKSRVATLEVQALARNYQVSCPWAFGSTDCGHTRLAGETCDHRVETCVAFTNQVAFGGFHQAPPGEVGT